jgi:hypothetical protein
MRRDGRWKQKLGQEVVAQDRLGNGGKKEL